jgi:iron complex outermembrane receptor protein
MATNALAAETAAQPDGASAAVSEVVVTGSSLRGVAPVGSPLLTVGREDIHATGATTTSQLLLDMPQVVNLGVSEGSRASNGGSANFTYTQGLNIHGIGPFATLLLLDGRRATPQGVIGQYTDTSVIPTIAVERIEIVPDGASAIYGSDAIAGVGNIILRRKFEGVEVTGGYNGADHYDEHEFSVIGGKDWGSGHATLAYANTGHSDLTAGDRSYSRANLVARGGTDFRSTQCNPANILISGVSYAIPAGGVTPVTAGQLVAGTGNRCELFGGADLLPQIRRQNVVATFNQSVTDTLSLDADFIGVRREVRVLTGLSTATLSVPTTNAFYTRPVAGAAAETINYAFTELPANNSRSVATVYQGTVGATLKLPHEWEASAHFTYGRAHDDFQRTHAINSAALAAALASNSPATAFNPYGMPNSAAVLASIGNGVSSFEGISKQAVTDVALDGGVFALPGGEVRLAVGYQHQYTSLDQYNITGNTSAPVRTLAVGASRQVDSAYLEVLLPLVGPDNAIPGVQKLDLDVAGRYDDYHGVGSTTNPKVGITWEVVDGLKFVASYGTSFRAPPIYQLHGATTTQVITLPDPLLGGANTTALQITGGNPTLSPETATTYSYGVDFRPTAAPGLELEVSYFNVKYKNIIAALGNNAQLLNQGLYNAVPGVIQRNPSAAQVAATLAQFPLLSGVVPSVVPVILDLRSRNLGILNASGIDVLGNYRFTTDKAGDITLGLSGTYNLQYRSAVAPGAPSVDLLGTILNPVRLQARGYVAWRLDGLAARATVNFTDSYDNTLVTTTAKVDDHTTVDLHLAYDLNATVLPGTFKNLRLALDVTNVFDSKPPFVNVAPTTTSGGGYDATLASPVGRLIGVSLDATF